MQLPWEPEGCGKTTHLGPNRIPGKDRPEWTLCAPTCTRAWAAFEPSVWHGRDVLTCALRWA